MPHLLLDHHVLPTAIVPECALLVYCGSLAKNVHDVVNGVAGPSGSMTWLLGGMSLVTCVGAAAWATVVARYGFGGRFCGSCSISRTCRGLCLQEVVTDDKTHTHTCT